MYNKDKEDSKNKDKPMDDFIVEIKKNIEQSVPSYKKVGNFRELLRYVLNAPSPEICIEEVDYENGDVKFSVLTKEIAIPFEFLLKYEKEVYSYFIANFVGELLVRENVNKFAKVLTSINKDEYSSLVNGHNYEAFGMEVFKNKFIFTFHISLLQSILTEDFIRKIKKELR